MASPMFISDEQASRLKSFASPNQAEAKPIFISDEDVGKGLLPSVNFVGPKDVTKKELPAGFQAKASFASGPEERKAYIEQEFPGAVVSYKDGEEVVKLPGSDEFIYLNKPGFSMADITNKAGDAPGVVGGIGAGLLTGANPLGAAAGSAAGETAKKLIGRGLLNIPQKQSTMQDVADVGVAGALGGAFQFGGNKIGEAFARRQASKLAAKGIEEAAQKASQLEYAAGKEAVGNVPLEQAAGEPGQILSKPNLQYQQKVEQAAGLLGVKPTKGMVSKDIITRGLESSLEQSPTLSGKYVRSQTEPVRQRMSEIVDTFTKGKTNQSAYEIGEDVKSGITDVVQSMYKPIQQSYDAIRNSTKNIEVVPKSKDAIVRNLERISERNMFQDNAFFNSTLNKIKNLKDVDQVKTLRSQVQGALRDPNLTYQEKQAASILYEKLDSLERRTIMRAAVKSAPSSEEGKQIGSQIIGDLKKTNKDFKEVITFLQKVGGKTKISDAKTVTTFLKDLENIPNEQISKHLFTSKDVDTLKLIKDKFPDTFESLRANKLKEIYEESLNKSVQGGDYLDPDKFLKATRHYGPQVQELLFGQQFNSKATVPEAIEAMNTLVKSFPSKMGPSGTPQGMQFLNIANPAENILDAGRLGVYLNKPLPEARGLLLKSKEAIKESSKSGAKGAATSEALQRLKQK